MLADLELRRRGRLVARAVSAAVGAGESLLVTGRNGAGKSTLLRVLAGVSAPSAGRLLRPAPPHAYVPERVALAPTTTVDEWLSSMRRLRSGASGHGDGALRLAGLDRQVGRRPVGSLSKGQLQRLVLAEALSCEPALLVLDEPWAGLDGHSRGWLAEQLRERLERGAIAVVTDHSGAGEQLFSADHRLHPGGAPPQRPWTQERDVAIVAVDPRGLRHHFVVPHDVRDARLRELLDLGWGIEEVRPR